MPNHPRDLITEHRIQILMRVLATSGTLAGWATVNVLEMRLLCAPLCQRAFTATRSPAVNGLPTMKLIPVAEAYARKWPL